MSDPYNIANNVSEEMSAPAPSFAYENKQTNKQGPQGNLILGIARVFLELM